MGLSMTEKKAVTMHIRSRYQKATRKEKSESLNEFIRLTGYNRKYALRILNQPLSPRSILAVNGGTVKLKPLKKRPANRKGKKSIPTRSSPPSASSGPSSAINAWTLSNLVDRKISVKYNIRGE
jgi:hypothetical protein